MTGYFLVSNLKTLGPKLAVTPPPPPTATLLYFLCLGLFFFWLHWVFVAARGLSLVAASVGYSSLWCAGFSLRWLLLLRSMGSRCTASVVVVHGLSSCGSWALERRLSSCGARA